MFYKPEVVVFLGPFEPPRVSPSLALIDNIRNTKLPYLIELKTHTMECRFMACSAPVSTCSLVLLNPLIF